MGTRNTKDTKGTKDTKAGTSEPRRFLAPNAASYRVIGCALRVHTACGPGGLENAISKCLDYEMTEAGLYVEDQVMIPLIYKHIHLPATYRADFIVEKCLVLEIKCVSHVLAIHRAQLLNYLKQSGLNLGLILNFNVPHLRDGIHRIINGPESEL